MALIRHRNLAHDYKSLYRLESCRNQFQYFQSTMNTLIERAFPYKIVIRHSNDKPWETDGFRNIIRQRQRAYMRGDMPAYRRLRNMANREATRIRHNFCQRQVATLQGDGSRNWWKGMKRLAGLSKYGAESTLQGMANDAANGDMECLARK